MAAWEKDHRDAVTAARTMACPLCGAQPGEECTYPLAILSEDDAQRFLRWEYVERSPHQPRIAVATDGRLYGYALRNLLQQCRCGESNAMAGRHPVASCGYHRSQA